MKLVFADNTFKKIKPMQALTGYHAVGIIIEHGDVPAGPGPKREFYEWLDQMAGTRIVPVANVTSNANTIAAWTPLGDEEPPHAK